MRALVLACLLASACRTAREPPIVLEAGVVKTLAIGDGVQITLHGPGRFLVRGQQLLVGAGMVSVDVAAQALRAGQRSFSLATPAGQVTVPFAARLVVRAQGTTELALVSGEALADGALAVGARRRVCFADVGPHLLLAPGFGTMEEAQRALPGSDACSGDQPPDLVKRERELAAQLELIAGSQANQAKLLERARYQSSHELVQALATQAQLTLTARMRALALRSQLAAAALDAAENPERAALLARADALESPAR